MVSTQSVLSKNTCFYKYAHNLGPKGAPDMILTHSTWNFMRKEISYLPRPETHKTKSQKTQRNNKMQPKMGPPERPPARPCGGSGGRQPPGKAAVCSLNITVNSSLGFKAFQR